MIGKKTCLLTMLVIFGFTACATMQTSFMDPCPLPNDINIVPPSPDLRKDIAAFSGKWIGQYENGRRVTLVVEQIKDTEAWVIYSWGPGLADAGVGYDRLICKVKSDPKPEMIVPVKHKVIGNAPLYLRMTDLNTLMGNRDVFSPGVGVHPLSIILNREK